MAFNLNKNENAGSGLKNTGFDLSKNKDLAEPPPVKNPRYWPYFLAALLIVIAAAWYLIPGAVKTQEPVVDSTLSVTTAQQDSPVIKTAKEAPEDDLIDAGEPLIAAYFESGATQPENFPAAALAGVREKLAADKNLRINVLGYASSEGNLTVNQSISQARADAYKQFLVRNHISANIITAIGKGIADPIAPNDTENGRKKNRRVEVLFNQQ